MAKMPYIPLYIGDWEQDANCLSLKTEAAWLKIIFKMFKNGKCGIYKTSTKALQNLWKCDLLNVQEIITELKENNVCDLETGETIVFTNRRMVREAEISEIRSTAVQNRYKKSTKGIQTPDIDNVNENENINDLDIERVRVFLEKTVQWNLGIDQVKEYWKAFLIHSESELYHTKGARKKHFRDWLKKQKPTNGTHQRTSSGNSKAAGREQLIESLRADLQSGT